MSCASDAVASVTLTNGDSRTTVTVHVGQTINVQLGADFRPITLSGTGLTQVSSSGGYPTGQPLLARPVVRRVPGGWCPPGARVVLVLGLGQFAFQSPTSGCTVVVQPVAKAMSLGVLGSKVFFRWKERSAGL